MSTKEVSEVVFDDDDDEDTTVSLHRLAPEHESRINDPSGPSIPLVFPATPLDTATDTPNSLVNYLSPCHISNLRPHTLFFPIKTRVYYESTKREPKIRKIRGI